MHTQQHLHETHPMLHLQNIVGFRLIDHNFWVIELTDDLKPLIKGFPGAEEATGIVCYGYIDHEAGVSFEVLTTCRQINESGIVGPTDGNNDIRLILRAGKVIGRELIPIEGTDLLKAFHEEKLKILEEYEPSDDIMKTRCMEDIDKFRHPVLVDDINVWFVKEGCKTEGCWVRIERMTKEEIIGTLLNEPNQDLGYHQGDEVGFFLADTEDGRTIPCVIIE